ncbi:MAG: LytR C-terminal domain-containing protein [Sphingomonas sp.]|uniref:LytR C-terminal domain-containing protein n=1 Tax=Sphingomonas sp. TaxID=28214 RepID=UPI001835E000|nr:LytR C-terminal domain-containing protein [Sphingomonas sp.]MBA3666826.1 LytR C-terminal domain-containing protein [Sphingomonas sp.]
MNRNYTTGLCLIASLAAAACSKQVEIRSIASTLTPGPQPANIRVAEGTAQYALGNTGLALEAFRKALREQPGNVEAMVGLAACYDRMGRFDLSRKNYEMALAVAPTDTALYTAFVQSLELQGQFPEAARVKAELAERIVAPEAMRAVPGSVPVLPPPPAPSVTVALAPPRSAPVAVEPAKVDQPKLSSMAPAGPARTAARLERMSVGEVALITRAEPRWAARTVARSATSTTIRFEPRREAAVTLLNAARVRGLAARTRAYLAARGFTGAAIGDAPSARQRSAILFGAGERPRAERLALQFGFALERQPSAGGLVVLLGRDAARDDSLTRPSA